MAWNGMKWPSISEPFMYENLMEIYSLSSYALILGFIILSSQRETAKACKYMTLTITASLPLENYFKNQPCSEAWKENS